MSTWKSRLAKRLTLPPGRMHPFPCSALLACFGSTRDNPPFDQPSVVDAHATVHGQPHAKTGRHTGPTPGEEGALEQRDASLHTERNGGARRNSSDHSTGQPTRPPEDLPSSPDGEATPLQTSIPRPSIVEMPMEAEGSQEEPHCLELGQKTTSDSPRESPDPKDTYLLPRNIMAEPDYLDDDNPELIQPQKLINPVKMSRNHQDLHRELLMNQKRGLAPQNKPELQKVMEKRKRDQVMKQKEEAAQKKKSDLEVELLKRQQKLEQLELEKQKLQEEQENAPEFVKVKGNLRRTGQEVAQAQES
ncbi:protein FAM107B isoform X1 [Sorex fumeus]|uniref:protein FAM107B isoform X1 n=2 Tax=Sorex fumeus TaxID=62283 RepID=UPI0024AE1AB0|nr:protein FAM107B isoform X1 [Sorex fumeus]